MQEGREPAPDEGRNAALVGARDFDVQIILLNGFVVVCVSSKRPAVARVLPRTRQKRDDIWRRIARVVSDAEDSPAMKAALRDLRLEMAGEGRWGH